LICVHDWLTDELINQYIGFWVQDSQEFLRCFMDHLHEELKQPVITNDDDAEVDANNSNEKMNTMRYSRQQPSVSPAIDCDASEPSDTDYETCDSGLSSESNSVTADVSPRAADNDCDDVVGQKDGAEQLGGMSADPSASLGSIHAL